MSTLYSLLYLSMFIPSITEATIVEFHTSQGRFQVNLFDNTTPKTVENFLSYVNDSYYTDTVLHRVAPNFVVQGGGYHFSGNWPLTPLETKTTIANEPLYSNVKGTIAMAKQGGAVNSASNQWFFNLKDNSSNLDQQNGGFTVFGQVIGDGMTVINNIAQLELCTNDNLVGIPVVDYSAQECSNKTVPGIENFVVVEQVLIIDSSTETDTHLSPVKNRLILPVNKQETRINSAGSCFWLMLLLLIPSYLKSGHLYPIYLKMQGSAGIKNIFRQGID